MRKKKRSNKTPGTYHWRNLGEGGKEKPNHTLDRSTSTNEERRSLSRIEPVSTIVDPDQKCHLPDGVCGAIQRA
jgi:hypothetical protein